MDAIGSLVATMEPDLVRLRRDLHRHPELAFTESRTAEVISDQRTGVGLSVLGL